MARPGEASLCHPRCHSWCPIPGHSPQRLFGVGSRGADPAMTSVESFVIMGNSQRGEEGPSPATRYDRDH